MSMQVADTFMCCVFILTTTYSFFSFPCQSSELIQEFVPHRKLQKKKKEEVEEVVDVGHELCMQKHTNRDCSRRG